MILDINMLRSRVKLTVFQQRDCSLIIGVNRYRSGGVVANFADKSAQPQCLFCGMSLTNIFGFNRRKSNDLLLFRAPAYCTLSKMVSKSHDQMSIFLICVVSITK